MPGNFTTAAVWEELSLSHQLWPKCGTARGIFRGISNQNQGFGKVFKCRFLALFCRLHNFGMLKILTLSKWFNFFQTYCKSGAKDQ